MNKNGFFRRALPWILGVLAGCAFAAGVACCIGMLLHRSKMLKECEPEILTDAGGECPDGSGSSCETEEPNGNGTEEQTA